ncbi:acyl-CoA thioesterase [Brachybacterium hainanense]|uniref:Acyl-CoA thioesterase n=1 Tax=Brachybacterium hainanense TaxID=1541174 RepID=A0ABV6RFE3_9MICO
MAHLDITVPVRWTDLDAYGHVNNAAVVRLLEEARIAAFWAPDEEQIARGAVRLPTAMGVFDAASPQLTLIASQRLEYHRPIPYLREGALVRLWISRLGGASLDVDYRVLRQDDAGAQAPYVSARTVVVVVDRGTNRAARLDGPTRRQLEEYRDEPILFRA